MSALPDPVEVETQPRLVLTPSERAGYERALAELVARRDRERHERMREARTYVSADAVEEIGQIQEEQAITERRIAYLERLLGEAVTVDGDGDAAGVVAIGSAVTVEYVATGQQATYQLTGIGSTDGKQLVSARSPVGQALMGRRVGDVVSVELPGDRRVELRIRTVASGLALR